MTHPEKKNSSDPVNTLTGLADFVRSHRRRAFDVVIADHLDDIGHRHDLWSDHCPEGHQYTEIPCEQFDAGVYLGIQWLMARIEDDGAIAKRSGDED